MNLDKRITNEFMQHVQSKEEIDFFSLVQTNRLLENKSFWCGYLGRYRIFVSSAISLVSRHVFLFLQLFKEPEWFTTSDEYSHCHAANMSQAPLSAFARNLSPQLLHENALFPQMSCELLQLRSVWRTVIATCNTELLLLIFVLKLSFHLSHCCEKGLNLYILFRSGN